MEIASRVNPTPWLLHEPAFDSVGRLFCIPYSGCGASMYRKWPQFIGQIEVCPIQLPGRENRIRESHYGTYEQLADLLIGGLLPYFDRPFAFFGHCGSALAAYESTVRLAQRRLPIPTRLFVSSQVAPHHGPYGRFLQMTDAELAEEMRTLIRRMGGEPLSALVELLLSVLRADLEANKRYRLPQPVRVPCPITAIGWENDCEVDPRLITGWRDCGDTMFRIFKGEHYSFLQAPGEFVDAIHEDMLTPANRGGVRG